ncbi:MAG: HlyD family efflux transporter periplasmic adaptor subunit [Treponema sp.]|jgi:multidrug resistance efflux pump|nr:HlyD family efflux transporter periplasmic adaptor subunit [Treponema sp.]
MMRFVDMAEFHQGYQFFMLRPSRAVSSFIITLAGILSIAVIWALIAQMDDVVKATALLRPSAAISIIKALSGGEVLKKNYVHDGYVNEGDLLLQVDVSADTLELDNSKKLMVRVEDNILLYNTLLKTIRQGKNSAAVKNEEAYIHSEVYLIEHRRLLGQIEELRIKLEREGSLPDTLSVKQRFEDMSRELAQAELQFSLWKNNQMIEAMNGLKNLMQNKETLERRLSDLERNIRNATFHAPISGRINEFRKLNIGDYLLPGEEIITIVPDDTESLKAELYIDPAYIAQVKIGQKATLRFPGLPPSKFGKIEAEISLIPADYIVGPDSNPTFIVEANIREPWLVSPKGDKINLRPGIGAMGRVIIDQDTVMRMILKKLDFINESYTMNALSEEKK